MGKITTIGKIFPEIIRYFHGGFTNRFLLTVISAPTTLVDNTALSSVARKKPFASYGVMG